jgi:hypothetical protein
MRFFFNVTLCCVFCVGLPASSAQPGRTYCNPLDLNYQYNFEGKRQNISYRSGADPVLINHKGEYYLFSTIAGGFWYSTSLRDWRHVKPSGWPERDIVAPAALSAGGKLFVFPSTYEQRPLYVLADRGAELTEFNPSLPFLPGAPGPWDPALFHDEESDRWYMYFGSSNFYPIYGIELDYAKNLTYRGTAKELIALRPEQYGWERFGRDHRDTIKPFNTPPRERNTTSTQMEPTLAISRWGRSPTRRTTQSPISRAALSLAPGTAIRFRIITETSGTPARHGSRSILISSGALRCFPRDLTGMD